MCSRQSPGGRDLARLPGRAIGASHQNCRGVALPCLGAVRCRPWCARRCGLSVQRGRVISMGRRAAGVERRLSAATRLGLFGRGDGRRVHRQSLCITARQGNIIRQCTRAGLDQGPGFGWASMRRGVPVAGLAPGRDRSRSRRRCNWTGRVTDWGRRSGNGADPAGVHRQGLSTTAGRRSISWDSIGAELSRVEGAAWRRSPKPTLTTKQALRGRRYCVRGRIDWTESATMDGIGADCRGWTRAACRFFETPRRSDLFDFASFLPKTGIHFLARCSSICTDTAAVQSLGLSALRPLSAAIDTKAPRPGQPGGLWGRKTRPEGSDGSNGSGWPGNDLLSRRLSGSTIGPGGLNDRVRDGIGWGTSGIVTRPAGPVLFAIGHRLSRNGAISTAHEFRSSSDWTISTGQLQGSPLFHTRPINVMVYHGPQ
jgi:hypothetical protein